LHAINHPAKLYTCLGGSYDPLHTISSNLRGYDQAFSRLGTRWWARVT
jgi:hypothetical protein